MTSDCRRQPRGEALPQTGVRPANPGAVERMNPSAPVGRALSFFSV
jgi:hypothetical protein